MLVKFLKKKFNPKGHREMTANEIEIAVACYFGYRKNIIVPNVSWGWNFNHESDLLVITPSGYVTEVEIKVNKYDLINDKNKKKWQLLGWRRKLKRFYFVIPYDLLHYIENIPDFAGILFAWKENNEIEIHKYREANINKHAKKLSKSEIRHIAHLGAMRIWALKEKLIYNK